MNFEQPSTASSHQQTFLPSPNTILLPVGLCLCGVLLLFFYQFGQHTHNIETIILGWGFIIVGILGIVFNRTHNQHYMVVVTDKMLIYRPTHESQEILEIPFDTLLHVQLQQSAVARLLHYGSLIVKNEQTELFLPDLNRPDGLQALLAPHLPSQE